MDTVLAITEQYSNVSSLLSAQFYEALRDDAGVPSTFTPELAAPLPEDQIAASMRWAAFGGPPDGIEERSNGALSRLVQQPGRDTITNAAEQDRAVTGVARVARPDACSFCKLLCTRGAVYRDGSFTKSNADFVGEGEIKVHDHCHCVELPVFEGQKFKPTPEMKHWLAVYDKMPALEGVSLVTSFEHALKAANE